MEEPSPQSLPEGQHHPEPGGHASPTTAMDSGALRRAMWQWVGAMVAFVVTAGLVGGLLFKVPYVALVPGSARDTESLVSVEGLDRYPSDGELLLTTVRVQQRPNLWQYLWLQVDDDAEIVPEDLVLGGRTPDENRDFNLQLMNDSKAIAIAVALEELGYEAIQADGVVILSLVEGAPAEQVLVAGDTVVAIDGRATESTGDLVEILAGYDPGDEIELSVEHYDPADPTRALAQAEPDTMTVVLGEKPDDPGAAFLGVEPTDRVELADDFDFHVDIDSGSVGGPSAGLAFTLAVLDELTPGELTGGAKVAVTGTIDVAGRVGAVGGVPQKTAAVRDLGADVFLVPSSLPESDLARIRERAGDDLRIIPVADLDEALAALANLGGEVDAVEEFAASNPS